MSAQTSTEHTTTTNSLNEAILVVKREHLFTTGSWQGLNIDAIQPVLQAIAQHSEFQPRSAMEQDPSYKQIIPYLIFQHEDRFFLMQRKKDASEQRLQNKYTLGIGGHMRFEDLQRGAHLFDWAKREFSEEVSYEGSLKIAPIGVLNDDSNEVGKVHLGLVLMLVGDSHNISIKSELSSGSLISLPDCLDYVPYMETWSQIALMAILKEGIKISEQSEPSQTTPV